MHIKHLDHINDTYQHVYLSPHLDDAALSCGGAIAQQRANGEQVLVVALCTAAPPPDANFSALAQEFHSIWQLTPAEAVAARLREETTALVFLNVDSYWAGVLDAIYRYPEAYHSRDSLFGTPHADDPLWETLRQFCAALRQRVPSATIYAPLGVGQHVDHQITYRAALDGAGQPLAFYEDFPYVTVPGALERRLADLDEALSPRTRGIDATLATKINTVHQYPSQLDELFGGADGMVRAVTDYAHSVRPEGNEYGERVWVVRTKELGE